MATQLTRDSLMARALRLNADANASVFGDGRLQLGTLLGGLLGALALSGLAELLLQRIVYRVGVHIPREGAFLEAYRFATVTGDFAFRTTAVLLAIASAVALAWLMERRAYGTAGLLAALLAVNLLAWPFGVDSAAQVAPLVFAFGAAWLIGRALTEGRGLALGSLAACAGLALAISQFRAGMTAIGEEPGGVATMQMVSEASLLAAALLALLACLRAPVSRKAIAVSAILTLGLASSYAREPSTVAIVSLWATGVSMSLPGILYILGFGAAAFAGMSWLRWHESRHLSIALALLLIAGLQPQALHHGITAFLGLTLLSIGLDVRPSDRTQTEVANAA